MVSRWSARHYHERKKGFILFFLAIHKVLKQQSNPNNFSEPIDSLAAAGAILSEVWTDASMPTVDSLGAEFLDYVQTGMTVTVDEDGTVTVE